MRRLFLGNDWQLVRDMTEWSTTTGLYVPKSGLSLTGFLSATKTGATIHATLSKSLTERASTGEYYATVPGTDLSAQLASYVGKVIYERVTGAGYQDAEPVQVLDARPAGE